MDTLIFHAKGSAKDPYKITAEGEGHALRIFCSCPAGRRGGKFCKHVAYLLQGDMTKLTSGSVEEVTELSRRANGSQYLEKADARVDADLRLAKFTGLETVDAVYANFGRQLEGMGWDLEKSLSGDERQAEYLELRCHFNNGKLRKTPSITLEYVPFDFEFEGEWGDEEYMASQANGVVKSRIRPWGVRGKGGGSAGTWSKPELAIEKFMALAESLKP